MEEPSIVAKVTRQAHRRLTDEQFNVTDFALDALEQALYARQPDRDRN